MPDVEIEYCVPCGFLDRAIAAGRELLEAHGRDLESVALVPGHGGVFTVAVDGEVVWDSEVHGEFDRELVAGAVEGALEDRNA